MKKIIFITLTVILCCGCIREHSQPTNKTDNDIISVETDTTYNDFEFDFNL